MLLDTSGLFCYYHREETQHEDAVTFLRSASTLLTHAYVLSEFIPLCHARGLDRTGALFFSVNLLENPEIEVVWPTAALHRSALSFLQARPDKTYSLCDAVSFLLMRERGIREALTTDRHFEQEGFVRLLK